MVTIKFTQGNTTWSEEVEPTYSSIYEEFMSVGNPQNQPSVRYEIYDDYNFYDEGEFPLFCDEAQAEKIKKIIEEIEKRSIV